MNSLVECRTIRQIQLDWFSHLRLSSVAKLFAGEFAMRDSPAKTKILGQLAVPVRKVLAVSCWPGLSRR